MKPTTRLRPGDLVEVKAPEEILETLDSEGTLACLPFMPEMLEYCSRRFRVHRRVVKTCSYGTSSTMRSFPDDDVVILEGMRCDGTAHDGCQKACHIGDDAAADRQNQARSVRPLLHHLLRHSFDMRQAFIILAAIEKQNLTAAAPEPGAHAFSVKSPDVAG